MANRNTKNGSAVEEQSSHRRQREQKSVPEAGRRANPGRRQAKRGGRENADDSGDAGPSNGAAGSRGARKDRPAGSGSHARRPGRAGRDQAGGRSRPARPSGLIETVRGHPVPAALVGAGLAWLVYESVRRHYPEAVYEQTKDALGSVGEGLSLFGEKLSDAAASTGESFREQFNDSAEASRERTARFGRSVKSGAARLDDMARDGTSAVGHGVERGYEYGRDALADLWQSHPLACGIGILAIGVTAGMLLPPTQIERGAMGERSKRLLERAGKAGRGLLDQGKELTNRVLHQGTSTLSSEAEREGLTPDRLAKKVKRIARRVGEAVSDAAEGE